MKNPHTYIAIMAGGIGSRFWPASRTAKPKQFLDILGVGKTLLRLTFERYLPLCPAENIYVVTNAQYKDLVLEQLPELTENQVLCEPSRNNTAPCIAYTAFKLLSLDPEANFVVGSSDHIILDENNFRDILQKALDFTAQEDALVTVGIQPTRPDTGYGYIRYAAENRDGVHPVRQFTEKPRREKALEFLASGEYLWNAGIFVWSARSILGAYEHLAPEIYSILGQGLALYNTAEEQDFIDEAYPRTANISVDYAIMEKASNVFTIPASFGWSDLGTWASLFEEMEKDDQGNALSGNQILASEVSDSIIRIPDGKLAVIRGLQDFIVVDEPDALLIFPKSREQEIKQITEKLKELGLEKYL